jgi:hypothetical protein
MCAQAVVPSALRPDTPPSAVASRRSAAKSGSILGRPARDRHAPVGSPHRSAPPAGQSTPSAPPARPARRLPGRGRTSEPSRRARRREGAVAGTSAVRRAPAAARPRPGLASVAARRSRPHTARRRRGDPVGAAGELSFRKQLGNLLRRCRTAYNVGHVGQQSEAFRPSPDMDVPMFLDSRHDPLQPLDRRWLRAGYLVESGLPPSRLDSPAGLTPRVG